MGFLGTHDEITCPKCGYTKDYYYGIEHDFETDTYDFSHARIFCERCGERLFSWQELQYGDKVRSCNDEEVAVVATCKNYDPYKAGYTAGRKQGKAETIAVITKKVEEINFADLEEKQRVLAYLKAMSQSIRNKK